MIVLLFGDKKKVSACVRVIKVAGEVSIDTERSWLNTDMLL
jgi:hypothetical protein